MWPTRRIARWAEIATLAERFSVHTDPATAPYLFRGQADETWGLASSLGRLLPAGITASEARAAEDRLIADFQRQAHLHIPKDREPKEDDFRGWLSLMQHHGAPTRLIDWSESIFVATYFAVQALWDQDAALYVIHAATLLDATMEVVAPESDVDETLMNPAAPQGVFPFFPDRPSARMLAQRGHFTISLHITTPQEDAIVAACRAKAMAGDGFVYQKYIIPADLKPTFLRQLRAMNVSAASLFPGIDGLGKGVEELARILMNQPSPSSTAPTAT